MHGKVGDRAVERSAVGGLVQNVIHAGELCARLAHAAVGGIHLRLVLGDAGYVLRVYGVGNFVRCFLGVKISLGDQLVFIQALGGLELKLGARKVGGAA